MFRINFPESKNPHVPALNLLRGIAALLVAIYHIIPNGKAIEGYPVIKKILLQGHLGLDMFFIISGFVIPYSMFQNKYSLSKFHIYLLKRITRIEPPYIISFLCIILLYNINCWMNGWEYTMNWPQFFSHFGYLNSYLGYESYNSVYWTLAIEFQFYILIGLFFPLIMHQKKLFGIIIFLFFGTLSFWLNLKYNLFIFQYGFHFMAGVILFLFMVKKIKWPTFILFTIFCALIAGRQYFEVGITVIVTVLAILFVRKTWIITDFFGKISYSFYLTHHELFGWTMLFIGVTSINEFILKILIFTGAIAFATIFYFAFERPALILSKRIKY